MKKTMLVVLTVVLALTVLVGCGKKEETAIVSASSTEEVKKDAYSVCFLVNGNLGDGGFYDSAADGIRRLEKEDGCTVKIIEMGNDETTYETYFRDVSEQDWDLIVSATWSVRELFEEIAADYPENKYLFLDGVVNTPNMIGITYKSNETGFMAGTLAARMLELNDPKIDSSKRILGCVASMDSTNLNDFVVGYIDGVKYIDPTIRVLTSYVNSFSDIATCLEMCTQLYNQGAQVIYAPTSQSMLGAVNASSNADKYLILCDTDVYSSMVGTDPEAVRNVVSSSLKKVGDSIFVAVHNIWDGKMSFGNNYSLGLAEGTVGLADNENYRLVVKEDIRKEMDEIAAKVIFGEIEVATAFTMEQSEIVDLRNSMKP